MSNRQDAQESTVTEADAREMIRLLGQAATLSGGHQEVKRYLMTGLCELLEAECWIWALACQTIPGEPQTYAGFTHGGFDEERFAGYLKAVEHPDMAGAVEGIYARLAERESQTTMSAQEIDPGGRFDRSEGRFLWQEINIGPVLLSAYPLDAQASTMIGIYRAYQAPPFGERESRILHTFLGAVPWLHEMGWPKDRGATVPQLQPRQRIVLNLLMEGHSRKAIADQLGISENTVAGYARDVFAHFGVHSQVELIRHFLGS